MKALASHVRYLGTRGQAMKLELYQWLWLVDCLCLISGSCLFARTRNIGGSLPLLLYSELIFRFPPQKDLPCRFRQLEEPTTQLHLLR